MSRRGFKDLTPENWLEPDPVTTLIASLSPEGYPRPITGEDWACRILAIRLSDAAPDELHRLFEVARGALLYGYFFYPLYTLGLEQMFRVAEAAVARRCMDLGAPPSTQSFEKRLAWLRDQGVLSTDEHGRWDTLRQLRNLASHPQDQTILPPTMAIAHAPAIAERISALFATASPPANE